MGAIALLILCMCLASCGRSADPGRDAGSGDTPFSDLLEDRTTAFCGNGRLEGDEQCDGEDLGGVTCESLGYLGGTLVCGPGCTLDERGCTSGPECVRYVDLRSTAADPDGLTWESAFRAVQDGVDAAYFAAPTGGVCEVWVASGIYHIYESGSGDTVELRPRVELYGGFGGTERLRGERDWEARQSVLHGHGVHGSAEQVYHVVKGSDDAVIDGFSITGGNAVGWELDAMGGGMLNVRSSPIVRNCRFFGNAAPMDHRGHGGGMANDQQSSPVVTNCTFIRNRAWNGGGMSNTEVSEPVVTGCTFSENVADYGAGMYSSWSDHAVTASTFSWNMARREGGGVGTWGSLVNLTSCTFVGNEAGYGGAVVVAGGGITVTNCSFAHNHSESGGGLYISWESHSAIVKNTILWANSPEQILAPPAPTVQVTYSDVQGGYAGLRNIDEDPLFVDAPDGDLHLGPGSPCIDAADGDEAPEVDLEGSPRVDDPSTPDTGMGTPPYADMGAYEYRP